jgi:DNA-binding HxlR family transcriptional regulator
MRSTIEDPWEDGTSRSYTTVTPPGGNRRGGRRGSGVEETRRCFSCELRDLLDAIGTKWSLLVVELLGHGRLASPNFGARSPAISSAIIAHVTLRNSSATHVVRHGLPGVPAAGGVHADAAGVTLLETIQRWWLEHGPPRRDRGGLACL